MTVTSLPRLLDAFPRLRVVVIGEAMLDSYLRGTSTRLCREAPVPIVALTNRLDAPGGAANTAVNLASLGAQVDFVSVIGDDREGSILQQALIERGVRPDYLVVEPGRTTIAKHRLQADDHLLVRFDQDCATPLKESTERAVMARLAARVPRCDAVVVSDYGYGVVTDAVLEALQRLRATWPGVLVVDAKDLPRYRPLGATAVKPNYEEVVRLLGGHRPASGQERAESILDQRQQVLDLTGARLAAVTLDVDGALVLERDRPPHRTYARPAPHARAAGAGDTYVSALALALAAGGESAAAAELAAAAAAVVIAKAGTATCAAAELRAHLAGEYRRVTDLAELAGQLAHYRQQGRRIVFTNGCFDLLHRGHISCLNRAKALGDVLIVGVNSDASVRRLKGEGRPINTLADRVEVLSALSCIDHLVVFDDDSPRDLIRAIRPDIVAKGATYARATLPEAGLVEELGGQVHFLPIVVEGTTSDLIERIRTRAGQGWPGPASAIEEPPAPVFPVAAEPPPVH